MDKELQEIKTSLDGVNGCLYNLTAQAGQVNELVSKFDQVIGAIQSIGQVGIRPEDIQSYSTPATLGDIKYAIECLNSHIQLDRIAISIETLTTAVRTLAEIQFQMLSAQESQLSDHKILPWGGEGEKPNLDYGWTDKLEPGEIQLAERGV